METVKINDREMEQVGGGTVIPYVVQPGDTLGAIASRFNVSVDQLMKWNDIKNPNIITVGQQIKVMF